MRKTLASSLTVLALLGGSVALAETASAAPKKKCPGENFQVVNGECVSDGKAEKTGDTGKDETPG